MDTTRDLAALDRDGMVLVSGAIEMPLLDRLLTAHRRLHACEARAGRLGAEGSLHLLGILGRDSAFLDLVDHPRLLPVVTGALGWNLHVYHSHLDAHPRLREPQPARWRWHQDGGRQNIELETAPRPRLSVKVAVFLTDLPRPGMGNLEVIPGSHLRNTLPRPSRPELGFEPPAGAEPVCVQAGDALVFDRRLWHARGDNLCGPTRRVLFIGYTYRWIRPRESHGLTPAELAELSPVRRQLLGESATVNGHWLPEADDVPLRAWMDERRIAVG